MWTKKILDSSNYGLRIESLIKIDEAVWQQYTILRPSKPQVDLILRDQGGTHFTVKYKQRLLVHACIAPAAQSS